MWVWVGGLVLIVVLMIYSVNYSNEKEKEREQIANSYDRYMVCLDNVGRRTELGEFTGSGGRAEHEAAMDRCASWFLR
jgi:hypothetical protein